MNFTIFSALALVCSLIAPARAEPPSPAAALGAALRAYSPAEARAGKAAAADAFFLFEGSELDRQLAATDPTLYREIESGWATLLGKIADGGPAEEVRGDGERILALLGRGAREVEAGGSVFLDSLLIILREGFEAILIVSALAAYLGRIGQKAERPVLFAGAALAVLASIGLWLAARSILEISGPGREALEGWTILCATGVLFWVSYWLVSKAEAARWQAFVRSRIERAVGRGALFGLGFLSFVVVFREGFETVLFYEAVAARAGSSAHAETLLIAGFATGCAALAVLYAAFDRLGPKLPMRAFFNVTGGLLYFMAFRFGGAGVQELQDAGVLSRTPVAFVPASNWLAQWFGVFPYLEPLLLQGLLLVLAVFALAAMTAKRATQATPGEAVGERRVAAGRR